MSLAGSLGSAQRAATLVTLQADLAQPHGSFAADGMPRLDGQRKTLRLTSEERTSRIRVKELKEQLNVTCEEMCEQLNQLTGQDATVITARILSRWLLGKEARDQQASKLLDAVCPTWADARAGGAEEVERQHQQEQQDQQRLQQQQQQQCEQQRALLHGRVVDAMARRQLKPAALSRR